MLSINTINTIVVLFVRFLVKTWKFLSYPILGNRCRFYPSCSDYLVEAVEKKGLTKGIWIACKRICRCHPFDSSGGGNDPVP